MAIYLDHAASSPMRPQALAAYVAAAQAAGNPSSLHAAGRAARATVEDAREEVAAALGAHPTEVVFTSGATEANNLALKGWFWRGGKRLVSSKIEHHAVLDTARWLETQGVQVAWVGLGGGGVISPEAVVEVFGEARGATAGGATGAGSGLVALHWVNNEIGVVQPMPEIVASAMENGAVVHADAAQAIGHIPVNFAQSGLASMAVSGHKVGGPAGIGALLVRREHQLEPLAHGGGQQRFRSGTLDAAGISAFAAAVGVAVAEQPAESARLGAMRDGLVREVLQLVPEARVSGPGGGGAGLGLGVGAGAGAGAGAGVVAPHVAHFVFPGAGAEDVLFGLDALGVAASSGSACTAGVVDASHVLLALGASEQEASHTLRVSFGYTTTETDIARLLEVLPGVVERARAARV